MPNVLTFHRDNASVVEAAAGVVRCVGYHAVMASGNEKLVSALLACVKSMTNQIAALEAVMGALRNILFHGACVVVVWCCVRH